MILDGEYWPDGENVEVDDFDLVEEAPEVDDRLTPDEEAARAEGPPWPLAWVELTTTVDAIDRVVVAAIEANGGWRLLATGMGSSGQTTLTYGWPWPGPTG